MQTRTAPVNEADSKRDKQLLEALGRSKLYRQFESTFSEATGLPLMLRPVEFFSLPFQGKKNENGFCALLAGDKNSCALCLQTVSRCNANPGAQPRSIQCPFGLTETTVPVRLGDRTIGFLCTGQVFTRTPKSIAFKKTFRRLFGESSTSEKKALDLWTKTPFIAPTKYEATIQLLNFFAKQLSATINQILVERENAEPLIITKAREFIAKNKTEILSLGAVAKAAGASVFHFCKVFHKTTGLKFTDYIARVRLEDARAQLQNPNRRISEIAYDVGFQSLTQFNRTFQRIFGQSPTEYRAGLPTTRTAIA
jgi:AraC-like DNA-binding protein/ligand-binding sensor protein